MLRTIVARPPKWSQMLLRQQYTQASNSDAEQKSKPFSEIPQPKRLPLLGTILDYTKQRNFEPSMLYQFIQKRHQELGPIYKENPLPLLNDDTVFVSSPADVETFFRLEDEYPFRPKFDFISRGRKPLGLNDGIANAQREEWYRLRKVFNDHLLVNKSIWMYAKQHLEVGFDLMDYIENNLDGKGEVHDFQNLLYRWALECTTVFTLDTKLGALKSNISDEAKAVIESTKNIFSISAKTMNGLPFWKYFNTKDAKEMMKSYKEQSDAIGFYVNQNKLSSSKFTELLAESDLDEKDKKVVILDILMAGVDTTSNATSFLLYCLAKNPDKQEILREEVKKVMESDQEFTGKTLQQMKYLHAANMEAQRLFPLAPGARRKLQKDMVFSGYRIPAGTVIVTTANLVNGRDPKYFEDPDSFIPERWLSGNRNVDNRFVTSGSFGKGKRMCPGRRFALQELGCLVMALLSRFKIEYHHDPFEIRYRIAAQPSEKPNFTFIPLKK